MSECCLLDGFEADCTHSHCLWCRIVKLEAELNKLEAAIRKHAREWRIMEQGAKGVEPGIIRTASTVNEDLWAVLYEETARQEER